MRSILLIGLALFFVGCLSSQKVNLVQKGVHFTAHVINYEKELQRNLYMVTGVLTVSNKSDVDIDYSNKDLFLVIETVGESREL